ncbi:MAG: glycosyltransferase family 4 protein [Candidatus Woesearchaeota archaeon]
MKKIYYYSGNSEHPYFKNEYKLLKENFETYPSNPCYEKKITSFQKFKKKSNINSKLYFIGLKIFIFLGIPKVRPIKTRCDYIFSCGFLFQTKTPYVVTFEDSSVFYFHNYNRWNRFITKFLLKRYFKSNKCKYIIPWTNAAKKSFFSIFESKKIREKVKVIYPSITPKIKKIENKKENNLLFIGSNFLYKGGWETYLAFKKLKSKNTKLNIVSDAIPDDLKKIILRDSNVKIYSSIKQKDLENLYKKAKIFVMPTHWDTLGFTFFEAMSYGLPLIGTKHFSTPEIIQDNYNGFTVKNYVSYFDSKNLHQYNRKTIKNFGQLLRNPPQKYIIELSKKMDKIFSNETLWKKFANNSLDLVKSGKFSNEEKALKIKQMFSN